MARDGSGNYNLPAGNPVVTGTSISSTVQNNTMTDVAAALTQSVSKDGQTAMTGTLNMGNNAISNGASITGTAFIPSGSGIPAVGFYLPSANTIGAAAASAAIGTWGSTGVTAPAFQPSGNSVVPLGMYAGGGGTSLSFSTTTTLRATVNSTGAWTISAPTAGTAFAINGFPTATILSLFTSATGTQQSFTDTTRSATIITVAGGYEFKVTSAHSLSFGANNTSFLSIASAGNITTTAPTSGVGLSVSAVSGTHSTQIGDSANTKYNAGFLEIPQNIQNAAYAPVLADAGKHIYHSDGTARTYTIPANGTVAYPIGTTLTFVNDASAAVNVTIAITTDTLYWAVDGSTGSRTLARYGTATALKVTATRWTISGTGLT
jgi:hypothetical protein